jgi:hypothetical protein
MKENGSCSKRTIIKVLNYIIRNEKNIGESRRDNSQISNIINIVESIDLKRFLIILFL